MRKASKYLTLKFIKLFSSKRKLKLKSGMMIKNNMPKNKTMNFTKVKMG